MFDVITKDDLWGWIADGIEIPIEKRYRLKGIQDTFLYSDTMGFKDKKILEIGGGDSRLLRKLNEHNECWNADKFEGYGIGPKEEIDIKKVKNVNVFLGEYSDQLPAEYFDYIFSISVVEHVPNDMLEDFFLDCSRVMKPGGYMTHAIDLYVGDDSPENEFRFKVNENRIKRYLECSVAPETKFEFVVAPAITESFYFRTKFATNSDWTMWEWGRFAKKLDETRRNTQSISLKCRWRKRD
ncbi:MAG: class I SAM-dependent methyltransferase [Henriciella sp.]|uniref:class I SAM-dependent methyltransferase n=1 Tax=Henriciella sp. TaxID=1968823 RepID=UPI0032ED7E28